MANCRLLTNGPTFLKSLKQLRKKFRAIDSDLDKHRKQIEQDYKFACNAFCVPMPGIPVLQERVYKYDIGSTDLRRPARECFRLIGILDDAGKKEPVMSAVIIFDKSDKENISPKEIKALYDRFSIQDDDQDE